VGKEGGRQQCPFCEAYDVERLFLASLGLDSCACATCGARWDERYGTGEYAGRGTKATVIAPRPS
jgi:transposase-like protein